MLRADGADRPDPHYFRAELLPGLTFLPAFAAVLVLHFGVHPERLVTWMLLAACAALAVLPRYAGRLGEARTAATLTLGSFVCVALAFAAYPTAAVAGMFALVVALAATLHGGTAALAVGVAAAGVVVGGRALGLGASADVYLALVLVAGTATLVWLGTRPLYAVLDWAWYSHMQDVEKTQQLRLRQGELGRLSKSLGETVARLEDLNRELERARLDAQNARRLKDEFATAVSHELRTPLNVIIAFSEMMVLSPAQSYGTALPPDYRDDVEAIYRNAYHLSNLIDDILDLSQIEAHQIALQRESIGLGEIVETAVLSVASLFRDKKLFVDRALDDDLPSLNVDPTRVRQVLINLLANAARFTDQGGVSIAARRRDNDVVVAVADTGVGMTVDEAAHVFEPFRQFGEAGRQRVGHGLGLAISKRLIELHGGSIWVDSRKNEGTTFSFTLPLQDTVVAGHDDARWERWLAPQVVSAPRTIAVIDEDGDLTRVMRRYLNGYRVLRANSRAQAERLAARETVHALVVSAEDGRRTNRKSNGRLDRLPVIICALSHPRQREKALGASAYLQKPVTRQQLLAELRKLDRPIKSILVVDDEPDMAKLVGRIVGSLGAEDVRTASDGDAALRMLRERPVDVLLLDLLMPGVDGYAVLAELHRDPTLGNPAVIVVSGRGREGDAMTASVVAVTRGDGLNVGEAVRAVRATLDAVLRPTDSARALSAAPAASPVSQGSR